MNKRVVFVVSFKDFRDEEYFIPKQLLESKGVQVITASNEKGIAIGFYGGETNVDIYINEIQPSDFDALVYVGGSGCLSSLNNETSWFIIQKFFTNNKIIAAICISPVILADSGILKNRKATVWCSPMKKDAVKKLKESEVKFVNSSIVIDDKIITANGPAAVNEFAESIYTLICLDN